MCRELLGHLRSLQFSRSPASESQPHIALEEALSSLPSSYPRSLATYLSTLSPSTCLGSTCPTCLWLIQVSVNPGRIDLLLGVDVFVDVLLHGRRTGPPGTPVALETEFGWVLSGSTECSTPTDQVNVHATTFHTATTHMSGDDILRRFWEIEESPLSIPALSMEERAIVQHFEANHRRTSEGRFVVPLPKKSDTGVIGESRSQAVRRFVALERSLIRKGCLTL